MQNRLTVPSVGTVFNNYLLPIKQFTANQWEKINEHQILSGRYSEVRAVVRSQKDAKVIKVLIVSRDECFKQLEKIKKNPGYGIIHSYFGEPKSHIGSILGPVSSESDLRKKLVQFNLVYCDEHYAKKVIGQKVVLVYYQKEEGQLLATLDWSFFHDEKEKEKFGSVINFYTPV